MGKLKVRRFQKRDCALQATGLSVVYGRCDDGALAGPRAEAVYGYQMRPRRDTEDRLHPIAVQVYHGALARRAMIVKDEQ